MRVNLRSEPRTRCRKAYSLSWQNEQGITCSAHARGVDQSPTGVGIQCPVELQAGLRVYVQDQDNHLSGYSVVRHCTPLNDGYCIGLELDEEARKPVELAEDDSADYYEFLQISRRAEPETINRVHRFLASRFHPDNPETGDPEKFLLLNRAFEVLSDPVLRAEYDSTLDVNISPIPAFESVDFMDGVEGEVNRRLAVLSLLYRRCRANVENPKVTLAEMEMLMGFPREYLDFTTWYLRSKKYITREDNSDFALTVQGVDYVESNYSKLPILRKLLNAGARETHRSGTDSPGESSEEKARSFPLGPAGKDHEEQDED